MHQLAQRFRRNIIESRFSFAIFSIIAIAMRLSLFYSKEIQSQDYPTSFVWRIFKPLFDNSLISFIGSTVVAFLIAYIFSNLNQHFSLTRFRTSLPFGFVLITLSIHPFFLTLTPSFISLVFILLALFPLLKSYQHHAPRNFAYMSGSLLGLAATFEVNALVLLPLWWIGEKSMHGFRIKSFIALFLGAFIVLWNVFGLYFIFDSITSFFAVFDHFKLAEIVVPQYSLNNWILFGLISFTGLVAILLDWSVFQRERVLTQKTLSFIILIIFSSLLFYIIYWPHTMFHCYITTILTTFIMSHYFSYTNSKRRVYLFFIVNCILLLIFIWNFLA